MQPIKFYFDVLSQPCRALYILLEAAKIPYEAIPVNLLKGEHMTKEFEKANRFKKVPAINDHGFQLTESVAILRHLNREKIVPEHWYPRRNLARSRIDEYMEWQQTNMRPACSNYFQVKWLLPTLNKTRPNEDDINMAAKRLDHTITEFENGFLNSNKFMAGRNVSFADLLAICEIDQPVTVGYNPFKNRAKLAQWYEIVREELGPIYKEVHDEFEHKLKNAGVKDEAISIKQ
ncbi:glutathione S-transferase theta-1 [Episyrphus balteatus]|uniref:glutathione S-transferase theta-1 n=1 Tax=Episyrphus balteatus TaxID=286459 RepID=UPI00248687CA|nr:glutathione S-transferase theta-1 [Episyrphus balteatus]